ncbi:MAG TPA: GNAT family N-acetyltransferase [Caulobacteraceae bacterium]|nr:GNAT family N-acetyltransferase [Caulobacteraceae bacterium]
MIDIRTARESDIEAIYEVALKTGDAGVDASGLHPDGRIVGDLFAVPYVLFSRKLSFAIEDEEGVGGYVLGALDTAAFETRLTEAWWPGKRLRYRAPVGEPRPDWNADARWRWFVHNPRPTPRRIAEPYPSHLHIDLLPRLQGKGIGRRAMDLWLEQARAAGSSGAHLGVSTRNHRALRFYRAYGLTEPALERGPPPGTVWFVKAFG